MSIIKGAQVAEAMSAEIIERVEKLKTHGIEPCLTIIRVGDDGSEIAYERGAVKRMDKCGIKCISEVFDESITQDEFNAEFKKINEDTLVHGILVLQPLPKHLSIEPLKVMINPVKDVDAISPINLYKVFVSDESGYAPCTAEGVMEALDYMKTDFTGKKCVVIGRSLVVGRPLGMLLLARNATVTYCHSRTAELAEEAQRADILIAAVGVAKLVSADYVNEKMTVIDVGINVDENGNMCGDVDFNNVEQIVSNITPVPGGVGAVTTSVLAKHVVKAAETLNA
ncbi:MAG: tetrahydrofolate dehydrogenase/cyclohydrolase catalytic domain-containing protein [Candidatus Metalachnospira sp.]|nr:tetrahydrofolate dehydrogenase/cyclohydrolase catalytic domain-containing protein [Candidatus Metalachnospira sp.]